MEKYPENIKNMSKQEIEKLAQEKLQQNLESTLLKIGGKQVEFLPDTFSMQINIFKQGKLINPLQPSILFGDDDDECEISSFQIYRDNEKEKEFSELQILSGFALGKDDQVWKMHTWLQFKNSNSDQIQQKQQQNNEEEEEDDQIKINKKKYEEIIQQSNFEKSSLTTLETTIEPIEIYYGYVANKDEIKMRMKNCEKFFDQQNKDVENNQIDNDEEWEDDENEEQWEDCDEN